ncbi:MAG: DUF401 family protein [Peptococcaceae bacterium]
MLILSLIISFATIIFMVNRKIPIGIAVVTGGILLSMLVGLKIPRIIAIIIEGLVDKDTIELVLAVIMITVLSNMMRSYGVLDKMVESLEQLFHNTKTLIFVIPSLLSTFSATGSAIVAAPILNNLGDRVGLSQTRKAAINIYIRHVWYFVLPIAVHLINASFIAEIPISRLILAQIPIAVICFITAYLVYLAPVKDVRTGMISGERKAVIYFNAFRYTSPVLISIILVFFMPFYLALVVSCLLTYYLKTENVNLKDVLAKGINPPVIYAAAGVMVFKNIIKNIPELGQLIEQTIKLGIPLEVVFVIMTLILAYVAANVSLTVSMMYPLVLPLVPAEHSIAAAMLIYISAYTAYMISPIHMCQALTIEYFGVSLKELYKEYVITIPVMFLSGVLTYIFMVCF